MFSGTAIINVLSKRGFITVIVGELTNVLTGLCTLFPAGIVELRDQGQSDLRWILLMEEFTVAEDVDINNVITCPFIALAD